MPEYILIIIFLVLLLFLLGVLFYRKNTKRKFRNRIADIIVQSNAVKSVPISFKLNKAIALAKINESVVQEVKICSEDFELIQGNLGQISLVLADTDDALLVGDLKLVKVCLSDLEGMIEKTTADVKILDDRLEIVLEEEAQLRARVNDQKESFRILKGKATDKQIHLLVSGEIIDQRFAEVEKQFSAFEEWMFLSEFNKSRETLKEIENEINDLNLIVEELPDILMQLQGVLPKLVEEVSVAYTKCVQAEVYVQHLQITKSIEMIQVNISNDLLSVQAGKVNHVKKNIDESKKSLNLLLQQLEKELVLHKENEFIIDAIAQKTSDLVSMYEECLTIYEKVSERFDFSEVKTELDEKKGRLNTLTTEFEKLNGAIEGKNTPISKLAIELKEYQSSLNSLFTEVSSIKQNLDNVRSDEDRAQKQLVKLYLILNEMRVKIQSQHLPSVSEECAEDMKKAYGYIETIQKLLNEESLNVTLLNVTLEEAIDYIYKLYNNVNNLVGMAIMVENTIVFGNRYRSSFQDIDSDLTRSELCFRNGEYTEALRIAIQAVEKVHPGSYEQLIIDNTGDNAS